MKLVCGALFLLYICFFSLSRAQELQNNDTNPLEVVKIRFLGNVSFSDDILQNIIESKESPNSFSKFLYHISANKLGSKPEYYDDAVFHSDALRLESFYRDEGYYSVIISPESRIDTAKNQTTLLFLITENARSLVDSVEYKGINDLEQGLKDDIYRDPVIKKFRPYQKALADEEIKRVLGILHNYGYPSARLDAQNSGAYHYLSSNNFFLQFTFMHGRWRQFGDVNIKIDPPRPDIEDYMITRHLDFIKGDTYSEQRRVASQRNLNRLDLFEGVRISQPAISDTGPTEIPLQILARPRDRHELSPELSVSDENNAFNLGLGVGYTNRNFLGDGRTGNIDAKIRAQSLTSWNYHQVFFGNGLKDTSVVGALELQFQILQPYLFSKNMTGSWTTSLLAEKQQPYILSIVRNRIGVSNRFAELTYGLFDWTLERVSPEFLSSDTIGTAAELASRREEDQPQFNSILTATLQRDKTNDIFSPSSGFFNSITIEESGILPELLPTLRKNLPFTQYYKVVLFGRWYKALSADTGRIFALKLKSGYQSKYGESRAADINIPLNRRFFGGGSGSLRGWRARELGAMQDQSLVQFGGNFMFEGSAEMRINHFKGMGKWGFIRWDNIWGVYFFDWGNVWSDAGDFRVSQIAMAAGLGFRYDTFFGPFRIDYGFKVYDPAAEEGRKTIFQNRFFADTFNHGVIQFGIGHAF
ncbi:MAG: outer membrane protein assembly factor [Bacteroidota bacterium]